MSYENFGKCSHNNIATAEVRVRGKESSSSRVRDLWTGKWLVQMANKTNDDEGCYLVLLEKFESICFMRNDESEREREIQYEKWKWQNAGDYSNEQQRLDTLSTDRKTTWKFMLRSTCNFLWVDCLSHRISMHEIVSSSVLAVIFLLLLCALNWKRE